MKVFIFAVDFQFYALGHEQTIPFAVSACGWQFIADALAVGADGRV
jgi:hypothetical protein